MEFLYQLLQLNLQLYSPHRVWSKRTILNPEVIQLLFKLFNAKWKSQTVVLFLYQFAILRIQFILSLGQFVFVKLV